MGDSEGRKVGSRKVVEKSVLDSLGPNPAKGKHRTESPDEDLPQRYITRESDDGNYLICREAPNIKVTVERGLSVSASSAVKYELGTIFLDGAAQGPPFLDSDRDVYSLDHHEGCVRLFTLSACEQAYILIRKGLNLRERDWKVLANEPDLDTVLAIWLILNHKRISDPEEEEIRNKLIPLVRLQGLIDVHGMDLLEMSCLPGGLLKETENRINKLREQEVNLRQNNRWGEIDFTEYTTTVLQEVDQMIYSPWHFADFQIVDELARVEIGDKKVAVICRSELGIYEVERQLSTLHDKRLGLVVLQKSETDYTLKKVDLFLSLNLQRVYYVLNLMDRSVKGTNRWGGSDVIGGSPRRTGTALHPDEIADALAGVFQKVGLKQVLSRLVVAAIAVLACLIGGWTLTLFWAQTAEAFVLGFFVFSTVSLLLFAQPYHRMFGVQMPLGRDWGLLFAIALIGAALGGIWYPAQEKMVIAMQQPLLAFILALFLPLSAELLFRGVIHGLLAEKMSSQRARGKWFLSWPVVISSLFYVGISFLEMIPLRREIVTLTWLPSLDYLTIFGLNLAGFFIFGLACGMARERSESLAAPILFHWISVGLVAIRVFS